MRVEVVVLGSPIPNSRYGLCNTELELNYRAQELRESRGGRPGLPSLTVRAVSVDTMQR